MTREDAEPKGFANLAVRAQVTRTKADHHHHFVTGQKQEGTRQHPSLGGELEKDPCFKSEIKLKISPLQARRAGRPAPEALGNQGAQYTEGRDHSGKSKAALDTYQVRLSLRQTKAKAWCWLLEEPDFFSCGNQRM